MELNTCLVTAVELLRFYRSELNNFLSSITCHLIPVLIKLMSQLTRILVRVI